MVPELAGRDDRSSGSGLDDERNAPAYGNHGHGDASELDGLDSPVYDTTVFHARGFDGARAGEVSDRDGGLDDGGLHDGGLDDGGRDEPVGERPVLTPSRASTASVAPSSSASSSP